MNHKLPVLIVLSVAAGLGGCSSMSGLDSASSFGCKAAPGVTCQSISGVHQNVSMGNLPFQRNSEGETDEVDDARPSRSSKRAAYNQEQTEKKISPRNMRAESSGLPVRQPPLILRVWIAPYEDALGDLHDQKYVYTMVHPGKWMIEANRNAITSRFRPIYPLNNEAKKQVPSPQPENEQQPLIQKGNYENLVEKPEHR